MTLTNTTFVILFEFQPFIFLHFDLGFRKKNLSWICPSLLLKLFLYNTLPQNLEA